MLFISSLCFPRNQILALLTNVYHLSPGGRVSQLYGIIQSINCTSLLPLKTQWEEDLNLNITDKLWQRAIHKVYTSSICVRHRSIQFKVFNRLHLFRTKLAWIYPNVGPTCTRCHQAPASLAHMFWSCPNLYVFRSEIFHTFYYICKRKIDPDLIMAIFGVAHTGGVSKAQSQLIALSSLLARRLILTNWKSPLPPKHSHWVSDTMSFLQLKKIVTVQNKSSKLYGSLF